MKPFTALLCREKRDLVTLSLCAGLASPALAQRSDFPLATTNAVAPILVSAGDFAGVARAARDLAGDIERVTGRRPRVDSTASERDVVIAGTLGHSALIDRLVREHKLDVRGVAGQWETWVAQAIDHPLPGVDRALVIAGSDKRGTIYGLYDLSAKIGVSPWTWWADVPVAHRAELSVPGGRRSDGTPAVQYRGIFLNDEAPALSGFTREKFGGFNHQFYERVFELILRLKGNYLWPAMWGNAFNDDDPRNAALADEYGIVMGTSHHEPMLRAQQEWKRYGKGEWNYEHNDSTLRAFWTQGIKNMGSHESIVTIGMRGDGDMPMTAGSNIALLERIVKDQRDIIAKVTGKPASQTPQLWALYKEVQDYYDKGMRVPDDVTLLFADDNWGNVRRLPARADTARPGGFGVYYHFDYVGGPRNYKWINTNPIARVWEQMHLSYAYGARKIWIVNVGDLKPMEFPISFFLDYAWNPDKWPASKLPEYTTQWAAQQFGAAHAGDIADLITTCLQYAGRRKPELVDTATYSLVNYGEADRVVADYVALRDRAERVGRLLAPEYADAYYELVQHPIDAASNLAELYVTAARNRQYAAQGRASANDLAERARRLFDRDAEISRKYNTQIAGGKWAHMMDQTHIGYTYWQEPPRNTMPRVDVIQPVAGADMGVAVVEVNRAPPPQGRGGPPPGFAGFGPPTLPAFNPYTRPTYHVDVFNRGLTPFEFSAQADQPWLLVSPSRGSVTKETRLSVSVDWSRVPQGRLPGTITITGPSGPKITVRAQVDNDMRLPADSIGRFVETDGYVSMQAEHYSHAVGRGAITWQTIPNLGRTGSAVTAMPVTAPSQTAGGAAPHLEYRVVLADSGSVKVHAYLSPTLNFTGAKTGLRYAVSFDDQPPVVIDAQADTSNRFWEKIVADNVNVPATTHTVSAGAHTLKFWMVDPGVVVQKLVIETRPLPVSYLGPPESHHVAPPGPSAKFDWFSYSGDDKVYKTLTIGPNDYTNPILAGFYPDPSIARNGDDYYLVTSSFVYYPGVPIFKSRDLVHWTQIGNILDRPSQLPVVGDGISRGIFAPSLRVHDGTFYMITTLVDHGGNFIVTATNPAGPWSDPIFLPEVDGIDPSIFFDDDGRAWILNNGPPIGTPLYEGHRAIWIQEYDVAAKKMKGPRTLIVNGGVDLAKKPIWIEAPHLLRVNGKYLLICAEGGTADQHSEVVFRGDSPTGPFTPYAGNPILTQRHLGEDYPFAITSTGHADFVQTPKGDWWAVFLGTRPYMRDTYNIGRETFLLPVRWENGWPIILTGNDKVPYVHAKPNLPEDRHSVPMSGNFVVRDDFGGKLLAPQWTFMRTVTESWWDLTSNPGWLTIRARPEPITGRGQPSFIGRRQQHLTASVATSMVFAPEKPGDKAGLVAFQNETHNYFVGVARTADTTVVELVMNNGDAARDSVIARVPVELDGRPVFLRVDAREGKYDFYFGRKSGEWTPLARDADGTILSTKRAAGFVGTLFGLYAVSAPR